MGLNNLIEEINKAFDKLVSLEIRTVVGLTTFDATTKQFTLDPQGKPKQMRTVINLLEGNITTEIDPEFVTGAYQSLRDYHSAREREGSAIVKANIEALEKLVALARDLAKP